jgi:glycosyltransferase involved in cell wall biosynthesis
MTNQVKLPSRPLRSAAIIPNRLPAQPGMVSVIIPTFNRAAIVRRAIDSALSQTYGNVEVIVVDDGSTDDTRQVVASCGERVRYFYQQNAGVSAARNTGLRNVRGEFVAFLDSDDAWQPWRVEGQIAALTRHPEAGLAWTDMTAVDNDGKIINERHLRVMYAAHRRIRIDEQMRQVETLGALSAAVPADLAAAAVRIGDLSNMILLGNLLHTSTVLVRRAWIEMVGGFDPTFVRAGEDYEFYVRLCSAGPVIFIDAPSTFYCVGAPDQLTRPAMHLEIARNNLRAIEKWVPHSGEHLSLETEAIRSRFADSFAWLAEAELDAGNRIASSRLMLRSIARKPGLDRRMLVLLRSALPRSLTNWLRAIRGQLTPRVS